jgi:hypothetical protein
MSKKIIDRYYSIALSNDRLVVIENKINVNEKPNMRVPEQVLKYTCKFGFRISIPFWVSKEVQNFRTNNFINAKNKVIKIVNTLKDKQK